MACRQPGCSMLDLVGPAGATALRGRAAAVKNRNASWWVQCTGSDSTTASVPAAPSRSGTASCRGASGCGRPSPTRAGRSSPAGAGGPRWRRAGRGRTAAVGASRAAARPGRGATAVGVARRSRGGQVLRAAAQHDPGPGCHCSSWRGPVASSR